MRKLIVVGCLLVGSASIAHADTQTRAWYVAHPDARARVNAICQNNPGEARTNSNCLNAAAADETAAIDRMIYRSGAQPTLFQQCASMPPLFQIANKCGSVGR